MHPPDLCGATDATVVGTRMQRGQGKANIGTWNALENGERLDERTLQEKLAGVLDCTVPWLHCLP